jgi:hypothetical protein
MENRDPPDVMETSSLIAFDLEKLVGKILCPMPCALKTRLPLTHPPYGRRKGLEWPVIHLGRPLSPVRVTLAPLT